MTSTAVVVLVINSHLYSNNNSKNTINNIIVCKLDKPVKYKSVL